MTRPIDTPVRKSQRYQSNEKELYRDAVRKTKRERQGGTRTGVVGYGILTNRKR